MHFLERDLESFVYLPMNVVHPLRALRSLGCSFLCMNFRKKEWRECVWTVELVFHRVDFYKWFTLNNGPGYHHAKKSNAPQNTALGSTDTDTRLAQAPLRLGLQNIGE
jgi:hypothetical protein